MPKGYGEKIYKDFILCSGDLDFVYAQVNANTMILNNISIYIYNEPSRLGIKKLEVKLAKNSNVKLEIEKAKDIVVQSLKQSGFKLPKTIPEI